MLTITELFKAIFRKAIKAPTVPTMSEALADLEQKVGVMHAVRQAAIDANAKAEQDAAKALREAVQKRAEADRAGRVIDRLEALIK